MTPPAKPIPSPGPPAAAIGYTEEEPVAAIAGGHASAPLGSPTLQTSGARKRAFSMETPDIVAVGVVILAIGAVLVAAIISLGFVFGKVPGREATEIILGCVSGSTISGVVAALLGRRGKA